MHLGFVCSPTVFSNIHQSCRFIPSQSRDFKWASNTGLMPLDGKPTWDIKHECLGKRSCKKLCNRGPNLHLKMNLDYSAIGRWTGGSVLQLTGISVTLAAMDLISPFINPILTQVLAVSFFGTMAIRSRIFSVNSIFKFSSSLLSVL